MRQVGFYSTKGRFGHIFGKRFTIGMWVHLLQQFEYLLQNRVCLTGASGGYCCKEVVFLLLSGVRKTEMVAAVAKNNGR